MRKVLFQILTANMRVEILLWFGSFLSQVNTRFFRVFVSLLLKSFSCLEDIIAQLEKNVIELEAKFHEEMQRNKMAIATQSDTLLVYILKCLVS